MVCQADCQNVQESRKTDGKTWSQRICSICWVEGGRYRIGWLVACCMVESAGRFQSRGAEQERTKWLRHERVLRESLMTKAMPPCPLPPLLHRSAILAWTPAGRSQVSISSNDFEAVVLNEGGYVGLAPGSADGSCIEKADKECVSSWRRTKGNVKQLSLRGTQRSAERGGCEVVTVSGWWGRWYLRQWCEGGELNWNGKSLARQADDRGLESWKNRMEVDHENRRSL